MAYVDSITPLTEWIAEQPSNMFPTSGAVDYNNRLEHIVGLLSREIHQHVEKGALQSGDGYLTDHGRDHVDTVIQRASALLSYPIATYPQLTAYEVYILLVAIHFHDLGNIFGRRGHEGRIQEIVSALSTHISDEMVERQAILKIARAHSGTINGNRDTISSLVPTDAVLGFDVRYQAIAAILRFADELADDSRRTARIIGDLGVIPAESEIYHAYARCLHSVQVRPQEHRVSLRYSFTRNEAIREFDMPTDTTRERRVFLLDEIFNRTMKMHFERQYCMRFMHSFVRIDAIDVNIEIFDDEFSITPCVDPIGYRLEERGYPDTSNVSFSDICPDVTIDGQELRGLLNGN